MHVRLRLQRKYGVYAVKAAAWGVGIWFVSSMLIGLAFVPLVSFKEEQVNVSVYPDHIEVDGTYLFENPSCSPIQQACTFPVAEGEGIGPAADMRASYSGNGGTVTVPVHSFWGAHWFNFPLGPNEQVRLRVQYRQDARQHRGGYVVTSTQSWGRALDSASFRIRSYGARIIQSSYPLAASDTPDASGFDWHGYMPEHDWTFAWEVL